MPNQHTSEQFWKLYEKLSDELKEAVFSVETSDNIWNVCENNNINEVSEVAKLVGQVLVGVLAPEDFQETLAKELKLKKETAKKAGQEINRFIFYPVRAELEKLYQTKAAAPVKEGSPAPSTAAPEEAKPEGPRKEDSYRESIE